MITTIRPVEVDGQFFIDISIDGCELPRRGPFATIDEVEVTANRLAAICRGLLHHPVHITQWKTPLAAQTTSPPLSLEWSLAAL